MNITIKLTEETIEKSMGSNSEESPIISLFRIVVPHFDYTKNIRIGAVKISENTAHFIIDCLRKTEGGVSAVMTWVNVGFSVDKEMSDWKAKINMDLIEYEEE